MNQKQINKSIDILVEQRKNLWTSFIVLVGGLVTLILQYFSQSDVSSLLSKALLILIILGSTFTIVLVISIYKINTQIDDFVNNIKEQ